MKKMAMPGDVTCVKLGADRPRIFNSLLISRVPNAELYDDDDYDSCAVLPIGQTKLSTYQGRFLTHGVVAADHLGCKNERNEGVGAASA